MGVDEGFLPSVAGVLDHCLPHSFYEIQNTVILSLQRLHYRDYERKGFYTERNEVWGVGVLLKKMVSLHGEGVNEVFK